MAALWRWSGASDLAIYSVLFGLIVTGHHLPGWFRAFGEPAVFQRYRARLLVSVVAVPALMASRKSCREDPDVSIRDRINAKQKAAAFGRGLWRPVRRNSLISHDAEPHWHLVDLALAKLPRFAVVSFSPVPAGPPGSALRSA